MKSLSFTKEVQNLGSKSWFQTMEMSYCDFEEMIKFALYVSLQGGPCNIHTAALAIPLKQGKVPVYKVYMQQMKKSANVEKKKCT